jgi:hypothetical protein
MAVWGMNINLPAIFGSTRVPGVLTHTHIINSMWFLWATFRFTRCWDLVFPSLLRWAGAKSASFVPSGSWKMQLAGKETYWSWSTKSLMFAQGFPTYNETISTWDEFSNWSWEHMIGSPQLECFFSLIWGVMAYDSSHGKELPAWTWKLLRSLQKGGIDLGF